MSEQYLAKPPRSLVFAVGGLTRLVSLFFLTFGVWGLWAAFMQTDFPEWMFAVLSAFIAMGVGAGSVAYRLISGRRRARDGGLLSPWALRAGGLIFAVGPIVSFFNHPWQVLLILLHWGCGGVLRACTASGNVPPSGSTFRRDGLISSVPPNTALQRTRSAPLRSPLSFRTFGA